MKIKKNWLILFASVLTLLITTFCGLFQPSQEGEPDAIQEGEVLASATPTAVPTLVPTNLVKLLDDGTPLPPIVVMTHPSGGQEIGTLGVIEVRFDQAMEQNSTSTAWRLTDQEGEKVDGTITWPDADVFHFKPGDPLAQGGNYHAVLSSEATSSAGVPLSDGINFEIVVADELMVSQVLPADGTMDVESDAVITVIFNRPVVDLMTVEQQPDHIQPLNISPPITGYGTWLNTSVYVYHPDEALLSSTTYTVRIEPGLVDTIGSELQTPFEWEFTTSAPGISSFGLYSPVDIMNPEDNYEGVRPESTFQIFFRQPMNQSSVFKAFSIYSLQGEPVQVEFDWLSEYQMIITPTRQLALGVDYTLLLTENAQAATGGNLEEGLRWNFHTLPFPGIDYVYPEDGATQDYYSNRFGIYFKSPMNLETIKDRIVVRPEPEDELSWYYDAWSMVATFYGLEPSTDYTISVLPGMEDIYGNQIDDPFSYVFKTGDLRPGAYLDLPYGPSIYRLGGPMKFYVSYVNVNTVDVSLYQIPASYFAGFSNGTYSRWDFTPPEEWWTNSWHWENNKSTNELTRRGVSLDKASGSVLEPGFYFMTINSPQVTSHGDYLDTRLLVVSEANLTFKTTQNEGLMWLTDLNKGEPMAGVSLGIYDENFNQIGSGATDADGLLYLEIPIPEELYYQRYVMTNDGEPFAFAISDWGSGVSPYEFGIWSDFYTLPDQPTAYVYTDRPLYRPGQAVAFKGIVRQNDDLDYSLLPWETVDIEISSYNDVVFTEKLPLSEFGTFDGEIQLDEGAALGYYSIVVRPPEGEDGIGGVGFSVAEYRKPEFQVDAVAQPKDVVGGNEFNIQINAEYFSGGGVANADVNWALGAIDYQFYPSGELSGYSFSDFDRDSNFYSDAYQSPQSGIIADGKGKTDKNGQFDISLLSDLSESGSSRKLTFEATVSDIAGTSVSDQVNIIAHQAAFYPGVKPQKYVGEVGKEQFFDLVVVDWDGEPVPGQRLVVEIVERRWYSIQEQDPQGYVHWVSTVEEIPVTSFDDLETDSRGRARARFLPENGGVYKAKVVVIDEYGNKAQSGAYTWISSSDYVAWRQTDDRRIELVSDKDQYQPGEVAEILIASPFGGANYALVTVERGHIREQDVLRLSSNSAIFRLPITKEMAPNIFVSAIVIQGADNGGKPDFRMGMMELKVTTDEQSIKVDISKDKDQVGPGDEVTYTVRTTDIHGEPVRAEVSFGLADLATLSLTQPNSRPILEYFYDQRSLSVRTAIPIVFSIEHYISTLEDRLTEGEGMGSGGGKGADVYGVFEIRGDFKDTAFWQARVITDQNGEAQVTVTLPDNLTIWRMDVRAVTLNTMVGDGEDDVRSTKPLLVRPQTPRFFVVGDQATIGTAVHNNTETDLSVVVSLEPAGLMIESTPSQSVEIKAGSQAYVSWDVRVDPDVDRVDLIFLASGGRYTDASKPTMGTLDDQGIPVYKYEVPETVGTAGLLTMSSSRTEGIRLPSEWDVSRGELTVKISPSLVAGMADGLDYLEHYPYECTEQTISRFLPNVLTTQALIAAGLRDPGLEQNLKIQVNTATQRLNNWQRPDGGWGWWPEDRESDPMTSAYVLFGLVEAEAAGYHVSAETMSRAVNYLKGNLQSLGNLERQYLLNRQTFLLYVLARAGEPQVSLTMVMYDARQSLSLYAKAYLAETIWRIDRTDPRLDTLISDLYNAAVLSATGVHWQEEWRDYWNWNTDTRTTATILATLIQIDAENDLNANAVRWLMTNRNKGRWQTTQETAWSLMALANWIIASGELNADYDWAVGINGNRLGDGSVNQQNIKENYLLQTDIAELFKDEVNRLTIARDEGEGNLYYTAHLNVYLPVDKIEPLDRGIIISREYFNPSGAEMGEAVTQAAQGDLLLARLTIVVPNDLHFIVINDPLPAGLEAVDQSLETSPEITAPERYDFESIWKGGWGWWYFDHVELRDEEVVISADYLPAGTYVYTYIVRAGTPGRFNVIPPTAQEFYFPEVYGRGAGGQFVVNP